MDAETARTIRISRENARSVLLALGRELGLPNAKKKVTESTAYAVDVRRHPYFDDMKAAVAAVASSKLAKGFSGLEIGAGGGNLTEKLVHLDFGELVVTDLDVEGVYVDLLRDQFGLIPGVRVEQRDFREAQPERESFDAVFSCAVDHHIDFHEKRGFLDSIFSVLKPGGYYVSADVLITPYALDDDVDRLCSVTHFHAVIVQEALQRRENGPARISYLAWLNELQSHDEFKLSPSEYVRLARDAGFDFPRTALRKVGPKDGLKHGIYVAVMKKP